MGLAPAQGHDQLWCAEGNPQPASKITDMSQVDCRPVTLGAAFIGGSEVPGMGGSPQNAHRPGTSPCLPTRPRLRPPRPASGWSSPRPSPYPRPPATGSRPCWRYIDEGIGLLAAAAIRLKDVVRLARKAGWDYLCVDGVNVPTVAFGRKVNKRQKHYSGKHKRHGVNVQTICAPDGRLLWASAAVPGKTTDITAARRHKLGQKVGTLIGLLADLGYLGLDQVITGYRRKRGQKQLPPATRAANTVHASLRCLGERGNAQLKWWKVMATELRCRPARCTRTVKAVLALHHLETAPFAA